MFFYRFREVEEKLSEVLASNKYDIVQVYSLYMSAYIRIILKYNKNVVLGPIDDEVEASRLMCGIGGFKQKLVSLLNYRINRKYYGKLFRACKNILFFSSKDIVTTNSEYHIPDKTKLCLIPFEYNESKENPTSNPYRPGARTLLFVGALTPFFNRDAVRYFAEEIFPIISKEMPDCIFYVVGHSPGKDILELGRRMNIVVTGKVSEQELINYISHADVYVSPLRYGTGIKTKIIEAFKFGKAIVSTSHSLNALWGYTSDDIRIADESHDFAQEVLSVLRDNGLKNTLEKNSRTLFETQYSYSALKKNLLKTIGSLA